MVTSFRRDETFISTVTLPNIDLHRKSKAYGVDVHAPVGYNRTGVIGGLGRLYWSRRGRIRSAEAGLRHQQQGSEVQECVFHFLVPGKGGGVKLTPFHSATILR